jgi:hypothetical protein
VFFLEITGIMGSSNEIEEESTMQSLMVTMFVISAFLATPALAGDVEDVKAVEMAVRAAEAAGNTLGYFKTMVPEFSIFPPTGGLLANPNTEENRLRTQAGFDSGIKYDIQVRNLDVQIYGRMTGVWVKEAGEWKVVHRHESRMTLRQ